MSAVAVVIASAEHALHRRLQEALASAPELRLVGEARDAPSLCDQLQASAVSVLVLDERLPPLPTPASDMGFVTVLEQVQELSPDTRTLVLCEQMSANQVLALLARGARGGLLRDAGPDALRRAIAGIEAGEVWLPRIQLAAALATLLQRAPRGPRNTDPGARTLTEREREVIRAVAAGLSNKEIARRLGISAATVKTHLHNVFEKLGVQGRLQLITSASEWDET